MDIPTKFLLTPYILFDKFSDLQKAYNVYLELINLYNKKSKPEEAKLNLARWYNKVEKLGNNQFNKVIDTFKIIIKPL